MLIIKCVTSRALPPVAIDNRGDNRPPPVTRLSRRPSQPYVKRLWNTLKTMFLNVKLQRLCKSHHLQCITSSKVSERLEKSLCVRDKAEDLCWMPVVFGPSDDTALLIGMILSLTLLNGPGILPETTVCKHNPPCHLQMPTKALSCKKEAICEHSPEAQSCPVGQGSFKIDCFIVEKCSMVRRVQIWYSCWKSQTPCPPG